MSGKEDLLLLTDVIHSVKMLKLLQTSGETSRLTGDGYFTVAGGEQEEQLGL